MISTGPWSLYFDVGLITFKVPVHNYMNSLVTYFSKTPVPPAMQHKEAVASTRKLSKQMGDVPN